MHILIIDDAADMRRSLQLLLNHLGYYQVSTADSGSAALQILSESLNGSGTPIDVILLDVIMPEMDGIEVCRRIKARPEWRTIPILMVTALTDEVHLAKAFAAGALDFLTKPVEFVDLIARLHAALSMRNEIELSHARERELLRLSHQLQLANQDLQRLAAHDELTGIHNRHSFDGHLLREWRRCRRARLALALLMVDVDYFKDFNDHYGHPAGDECLRHIAGVLRSALKREGDLAARFGGDEFVLILPATEPNDLASIADELRAEVEKLNIPHEHSQVQPYVTISLGGVSVVPQPICPPDEIVSLADHALYDAKHAGRNQACIGPVTSSPHEVHP
jgi:diguanylate cyclase (GGDEF)-like protein